MCGGGEWGGLNKAQTSLRIATDQASFGVSKLKRKLSRLNLHLSKCHIVGNHMSRLHYFEYRTSYRPAHKILVLITYAHMPLIKVHANMSSKARGLNFGLSLLLHPYLPSIHICTDSSEPSLITDAISTKILCNGPYVLWRDMKKIALNTQRNKTCLQGFRSAYTKTACSATESS